MPFCSKCGTQALSDNRFCSSCGTAIAPTASSAPPLVASITEAAERKIPEIKINQLDQKLHLVLISAASIAVVLLYTTFNFGLIGAATGVCLGLSVRLFFSHKNNDFKGTSKLDWIMLVALSSIAFILMLAGGYNVQALLLVFVAVRSLIMYLKISSDAEKSA